MDHAALVRRLCGWFAGNARALPWRVAGATTRRDPYATLVSEIMLQQTQVSRVVDKFAPFLERFPDVAALARAHEDDVLAAWTGLGYYRRARSLHAAAKQVRDDHAGAMPRDHADLLALKGVGRYTAGAIASIAYDDPAPIVDGNVARVALRVLGRELPADDNEAVSLSWAFAGALVDAAPSPGDCNEAIMELGATVCTPLNPRCERCPVSDHCEAFATGRQSAIPKPKARAAKKPLFATVVLWSRGDLVAIEQRPRGGLWGGLWQAPTLESDVSHATAPELLERIGCPEPVDHSAFTFQTTHRDVRFRVFSASGGGPGANNFRWADARRLGSLAMSSPQRRLLLGREGALF